MEKNKNLLLLLEEPHKTILTNANTRDYTLYIHNNIRDSKLSFETRIDLLLCSNRISNTIRYYTNHNYLSKGEYSIQDILELFEKSECVLKKELLGTILEDMIKSWRIIMHKI